MCIFLLVVYIGLKLTAETVESATLALEGVDDVHGCDGLSSGVLCVGHRVADDVLEEDLEDAAGLLVDEAGDTLDATTTSETADSGLCDALDVVTEQLAMSLRTLRTLATERESLTTFATTTHVCCFAVAVVFKKFVIK